MLASRGGESMRAVVFVGAEVKEEGRDCSHAVFMGAGDTFGLRNTARGF